MRHTILFTLLLNATALWAKPLQQITLQMHWQHQFEYAGYYVAKERGYYRDVGLDVVMQELPRGRTEMELLLAGEADYAITGSNVLVDRIEGEPVVAVAAFSQYSPISLLVLEASDIRSASDLRGKRIMVSKDNLTIFAMLNQAGLEKGDYTVQPQSFNLQDLVEGKTDAFAAFTTNQGFLLKEQGIPYRYITPTDLGIDTYSDVLITTEREAREHHQRVVNFREATIRGWEYAYKHIDEVIELILAQYNSQNKSRAALEFEARALRKLAQPLRIELGQMRPEKWEEIRQVYVAQQQLPPESSIEGLLFDERRTPAIELSAEERQWLKSHPRVRIGVDPDWFPFEYLDGDGRYRGVVADVMQRVGELLGTEMVVVEAPSWSVMMERAEQGEVDLVAAIMPSREREQFLNFTPPYYRLTFIMVTHGDQPQWSSMEALEASGATVVVPEHYITHDKIERDYPNISITVRSNVLEVLQAVEEGRADVAIVTMEVAAQLIQAYQLEQLRFGAPVFAGLGGLSIGVRKDWSTLSPILQRALAEISTEEIQRIRNKWMAVPITVGMSLQQVLLLSLIIILVLGTIISIIWRSNREIHRAQYALVAAKEEAEAALLEVKREVVVRKQAEQRAQQADRAKSDFLANMSHELRTPLNAVVGFNSILSGTELSVEQKKYVEHSLYASKLLLRIISDVLDLSKIEARKIELEENPFELSRLFENLFKVLEFQAEERGISLDLEIAEGVPNNLSGDPLRLEQILLNLGGNALKFSSEGVVRFVVVPLDQTASEVQLQISVSDCGVGISEENQKSVFDTFTQIDRTTQQQYGGCGLGLPISKKLVEQMGGEMRVESELGIGSCFRFTVHLRKSEVKPPSEQRSLDTSALKGMKILLVEDNEMNQVVIAALLRNVEAEWQIANQGEEAIRMVNRHPFDLVLMDIQMPVMDGLQATRALREQFSAEQLPIIGTSANIFAKNRVAMIESGMNGYLLKPMEDERLYRKLLEFV